VTKTRRGSWETENERSLLYASDARLSPQRGVLQQRQAAGHVDPRGSDADPHVAPFETCPPLREAPVCRPDRGHAERRDRGFGRSDPSFWPRNRPVHVESGTCPERGWERPDSLSIMGLGLCFLPG
jgi:hypothetical protein